MALSPSSRQSASSQSEFERVVMPHLDVLYRMGLYLTRDATRAEDLSHDAVLKAMRSFSTFRPGTNVRSWLARVVHTTFLDQRRKEERAREEAWDHRLDETLADESAPRGWEPAVVRDALDDAWENALAQLPPGWRTTLMMVDVEGWSYEEVADALSIPVGTVRSRLHRARRGVYETLRGTVAGGADPSLAAS